MATTQSTITVWSDIHCPWATTVVHRLRRARDQQRPDLVIDQRAWPLELVNNEGTPRHIVEPETAVLSNREPELFSAFRGPSWPSTFLPAFELIAAARRRHGPRVAEDVDYALRLAFFRDCKDVSVEIGLKDALQLASEFNDQLDPDGVLETWRTEPVRADVFADFAASKELPIQGSPQIFWPDGSTTHNPGLTDHEWVRGIPRLRHDDEDIIAKLIAGRVPE